MAPAGPLPAVRHTDAAFAFDAQVRAAPALNRLGLRALPAGPRGAAARPRLRRPAAAPRPRRARALPRPPRARPGRRRGPARPARPRAALLLRRRRRHARPRLRRRGGRGPRPRAAPRRRRAGEPTLQARDTGAAAYSDGTGTFHPAERRIERGADIAGERIVTVDACVIGSGAGGAPVAKELAEGGMRVAILEEGDWHDTDEFTARPARHDAAALPRRRADRRRSGRRRSSCRSAARSAARRWSTPGTCFRTPEHVMERWRAELGLEALSAADARPVLPPRRAHPQRRAGARRAGRRATRCSSSRGADALGLHGDFLYRNARGCVGLGRVRLRLPVRRQAARRDHLRPARLGRRRDDVHRRARAPHRASRAAACARSWRARPAAGRCACAASTRSSSCGALLTPLLLRPQRHRHASPAARAQPVDPPGDRGPRGLRRAGGAVEGRAAELLHRPPRGRGDHARGDRRPSRPGRDLDAAHRGRAPRAHARRRATPARSA